MWSPWKESLLRGLVTKAATLLAGIATEAPDRMIDEVQALLPELPRQDTLAHVAGMPPGYLGRFGPEVVASHLRLTHPPLAPTEVRTTVVRGAPVSNLVVAARDRPGLLATVAGALALHNLSVVEARVVTRNDGLAIDTFRVLDARGADMVGQGRWPGVRETLERAFAGSLDLESRLAEKRTPPSKNGMEIRIIGSTIEVRAPDRVGLLHDLALALTTLGLEIALAKIDTRAGEAVDVFEVRRADQVTEEEIRTALWGARAT
jgi:[protein-PII] uridylyltransferase